MDAETRQESPPASTDLAEWQRAVANGRFCYFRMEAVVAALQDLGPDTDKTVRMALAKHLSDDIYKRLWRNVGRNHPNQGQDIIDRVHFQLFEALARPKSADGKALRVAFVPRVMFRLKDAIAKEARDRRVPDETNVKKGKAAKKAAKPEDEGGEEINFVGIDQHPDLAEDEPLSDDEHSAPSSAKYDLSLLDGVRHLDEQIDVDRFLEENIPDDRKRLAFRLFMDEYPFKSKKSESIALALDIDERTARQWIEEIQEQLKAKVGDKA